VVINVMTYKQFREQS